MKYVHDTMASELDWIRLCERLGTEERVMTEMDAQDPEGMSRLEVDLRLSMFRNGFNYAVVEQSGWETTRQVEAHRNALNDADYAAGYSSGSTILGLAVENYRMMLMGVAK